MSGSRQKQQKRRRTPRQQAWYNMRILREFTISNLMMTVPALSYKNARKILKDLCTHGYVRKTGAEIGGEFQMYQLCKNVGPLYPVKCDICGSTVEEKVCDPSKKERETETERGKKKKSAVVTESVTAEELDALVEELDKEEERERHAQRERKTAQPEGAPVAAYSDQGWHVVPEELKERLESGLRGDQ